MNKRDIAWSSIISGLSSSGELSPERLGQEGGIERVRTLATHAAGLASEFYAAYVKADKPEEPKVEE